MNPFFNTSLQAAEMKSHLLRSIVSGYSNKYQHTHWCSSWIQIYLDCQYYKEEYRGDTIHEWTDSYQWLLMLTLPHKQETNRIPLHGFVSFVLYPCHWFCWRTWLHIPSIRTYRLSPLNARIRPSAMRSWSLRQTLSARNCCLSEYSQPPPWTEALLHHLQLLRH